MGIDEYIREHIDKEPEHLYNLYRATNTNCCTVAWLRAICKAGC